MNARTKTELLQAEWEERRSFHQVSKPAHRHAVSAQESAPVPTLNSPGKASQTSGKAFKAPPSTRVADKEGNPVIQHLDNLQQQLSQQLDSLNTVVASMQRISAIMDRMAKKKRSD